jgi:2,4-dienoyl-CoA reductase-like NADH-dependent reductase (Old Yellow Enzyme family)
MLTLGGEGRGHYPTVESSIELGTMRLRNRTAVSPMSTYGMASDDGSVTERLIAYYEARARGGFALITTEATLVHPSGRSWPNQLSIFDDRFVPGLGRLATAIKRRGAAAAIQLHHGGGFATEALTGRRPMAASPQPAWGRTEVPREMSIAEIHEIEEAFASAAARARDAGFDGVELHMGTVYLILSFISPAQNHRRDEYGGDFEGRLLFPVRIIERIRELVGHEFPLGARIVATDYYDGGIDLDYCIRVARRLAGAGITYLDVSTALGPHATRQSPLSMGHPEAVLAHFAAAVKRAVSVPVISVGRYLSLSAAESVLAAGKADVVAFGRASLADPAIVAKSLSGRERDVIPCIASEACFALGYAGLGTSCLVNPTTGHESELSLVPAARSGTVLVRGSGMPGLEVARVAALRGFNVTVATEGLPFGGLLTLRSHVPGAGELGKAVRYFRELLRELGVRVVEEAPRGRFDVEVDARPGRPIVPDIRNLDAGGVVAADDLLRAATGPEDLGYHVVVVGRGLLGGETALLLAIAGKDVTLISDGPGPWEAGHSAVADRLILQLADVGVRTWADATPVDFGDDGLRVKRRGRRAEIAPADQVVAAIGWVPIAGAPAGVERISLPDQWEPFDVARRTAAATRAAHRL